jgi:hypothetical protein
MKAMTSIEPLIDAVRREDETAHRCVDVRWTAPPSALPAMMLAR